MFQNHIYNHQEILNKLKIIMFVDIIIVIVTIYFMLFYFLYVHTLISIWSIFKMKVKIH